MTASSDKQRILNEISQTAEANGGVPLGVAKFFQATGIKVTDWEGKFWVRWGDALREAGFEPNQFNAAYDKQAGFRAYSGILLTTVCEGLLRPDIQAVRVDRRS